MQKIKINDEIIVLSGKDKGKSGKVLKINKKTSKVLVQGINMRTKSMRATQDNPQGGHAKVEGFISLCKVGLKDPKDPSKPTRVKFEKEGENWVRIATRSGEKIGK